MKFLKIRKKVIFYIILIFPFYVTTQSHDNDEIFVGMPINIVCKNFSFKFSDRKTNPCHGYVQYNEKNNRIMLWNRDETLFMVFNNVPSSAFNKRERLNFKKIGNDSELLLITSSGEEGLFFLNNMPD